MSCSRYRINNFGYCKVCRIRTLCTSINRKQEKRKLKSSFRRLVGGKIVQQPGYAFKHQISSLFTRNYSG